MDDWPDPVPDPTKSFPFKAFMVIGSAAAFAFGMKLVGDIVSWRNTGKVQQELIQAAVEINKTLPKQIDGVTVLESVSVDDMTLTYHSSIKAEYLPTDKAKLDIQLGVLQQDIKDSVCHQPSMESSIKNGVSYVYEYHTVGKLPLTKFTVGYCAN
jgi:hypothetical protein